MKELCNLFISGILYTIWVTFLVAIVFWII